MTRRRLWFAAVSFLAIFGVGEFARYLLTENWWGLDLHLVLDAGARWASGGDVYADERFLYPPIAAVIGAPLAELPFALVSITWGAVKIALAVVAVRALTRQTDRFWRVLAVVAVVASLPFVHDLMLGNVNALLVAAAVPAVFLSPVPFAGVALGVTTALFAKPLAIPLLLWVLVWRRAAFTGAVAGGVATTLVGLVVAGPAAYADWLQAVTGGTRYASAFAGNHGVSALAPDLWVPVAVAVAVALVVVLLRRGPDTGLVWASAAGLLIAPYAGTYSALTLALAVPVLLRSFPNLTLGLVALSPILTTHPLPFLAAGVLVAGLAIREERAPRRVIEPAGTPSQAPIS
jgi:hypothetical protein